MSRSIIPDDREGVCWLCSHYGKPPAALRGGPNAIEVHHIMGGSGRKLSEHYGIKVHLCVYHHRIGDDAVHNNRFWDLKLKRIAEQAMDAKYGTGSFRQIFGRSYVERTGND